MRKHHERITFAFEVCNAYPDELDVDEVTRTVLAAARSRLAEVTGSWVGELEHRPLGIVGVERRMAAFTRIEVTSPPTIPGRILTYLLGLTLAADRLLCERVAARLGHVRLRGPRFDELRALRAVPFEHGGRTWLLEWHEGDPETFQLSASASEPRLVAGQLDDVTRRRVDDARCTGRGGVTLSHFVFLGNEAALVQGLEAGSPVALDLAPLAERMTPAVWRALLGSARHHGFDALAPVVRAIAVDHVTHRDTGAANRELWRSGDERERALALIAEDRTLGCFRYAEDGRVVRVTSEQLDPMLAEALAAGGLLREVAQRLIARRR